MRPVILADQLSKRYEVSSGGSRGYHTLRENLTDAARGAWRRVRQLWARSSDPAADEATAFWALRDVSFEVQRGEVLGLVGRNGAGKSTLLKILSRITTPTAGEALLHGRVGSLLEVGTGFHPELTGRENIYLNGAILGMRRREIASKFDEIVAFAEVDRFLDTPVKRYSSGMYTRLAFAVASHLEPEVLVVDEVLAVGDAAFQKKCLGKMGQVSRAGRTVLFVSHNMTAVKSLCTRALLLAGGRVTRDGEPDEVVNRYLSDGSEMAQTGVIPADAPRSRDVPGEAAFQRVWLTDQHGDAVQQLYFGQPFQVHFVCEVARDIPDGHFEVSVSTADGVQVTYSTTLDGGRGPGLLRRGVHEVSVAFDAAHLLPREYTIDLGVHHQNGATADFVQRTFDFTVLRVAETGDDHYPWPQTRGFVRAPGRWTASWVS